MTTNQNSTNPINILLVEDNPGEARLALEALKESRLKNKLFIMEDGEEALFFLYKKGKFSDAPYPDLILLDLNLPKKNGLEVLSIIKHDTRLRRIPVIILTISSAVEDVLKSYNLYANCYITKPIDLAKFTEVIKTIEDFWISTVKLPPEDSGQ
ncbi:MAG: response regulator [Bacteroidales bacterium]|nr:response regulator [Bacteroidales bacterium]